MSDTNIGHWMRIGVIAAVIAGSTAACHYKAGFQYKAEDEAPGADSGTRRIVTTAMPVDSTNTVANPAMSPGVDADTLSAGGAPGVKSPSSASPKRVTKAKSSATGHR